MKKNAQAVEPMLDEKGRKPLKLDYGQTFKVGFAFAIIMLFWTAYDFVVPLLLEHAYGLPNWARGIVMGLDNLLSLFMLPVFGKLSDKSKGKIAKKYGRRTPFIIVGTIASVVLMIFVPVATLNQQKAAANISANIEAQLNDDAFMAPLLTEWYENSLAGKEGSKNYCDLAYLDKNDISREDFIAIRFDGNLTTEGGFIGIGSKTYYNNGTEKFEVTAAMLDGVGDDDIAYTKDDGTAVTYSQIKEGNSLYNKFVASGINNYESDQIYSQVTQNGGQKSLAVYMVILLLVLVAMATFRSPAVALMPDVTPKPLRSQANAVINLCGGIGGAIAFLIYTVVLFGTSLYNYVIIFASVAAGMLLLLAGFLALVNERKMVAKCQEICKEYEIDDFEDEQNIDAEKFAEELIAEGDAEYNLDSKPDGSVTIALDNDVAEVAAAPSDEVLEIARAKVAKRRTPKQWWASKTPDEKAKLRSFALILASIFMWFMGYNAISSNLSIYTTKELNLSAGVASIISGVSMGISAIAFIPVGYMAAKIGRRKSIMIGFCLAIISFVLIFAFVHQNDKAIIPAVLFSLFYLIAGFGLIIANVNTFPMVTELSTAQTVGQYTGYYYMATMSAQAITPTLGGLVMDYISNRGVFVYSAICIAAAIILMIFVKHGDSKQITKGKLTKEQKKQIRLDAMDAD